MVRKQEIIAKFCFPYFASWHQAISKIKLQPDLKLEKRMKFEKISFSIKDPLKSSKHQKLVSIPLSIRNLSGLLDSRNHF